MEHLRVKKALINAIKSQYFWVGIISLTIFLSTGLLPCGWLDTHLKRTACLVKIEKGTPAENVAFTPDGSILAISSFRDGKLWLWNVKDTVPIRTLAVYGSGEKVISPDGRLFALPQGSSVQLWDIESEQLLSTLWREGDQVMGVAFSPNGELLAANLRDKILVWRIADGFLLYTLEGHKPYINDLVFSPDNQVLASASDDGTIRLWRVSDGELISMLEDSNQRDFDSILSLAFSPDGEVLAAGSTDNAIRLWRVSDGVLLRTLKGHWGDIESLVYSPDGKILVSGDGNGVIRIWQATDGTLLRSMKHGLFWGRIRCEAFSPDGKLLATAQGKGSVRLFDVQQLLNNSPPN